MPKNVYIFGAGADKNAYGKMPLGNDFVVRIFANLDETKKIIKGETLEKQTSIDNEVYKSIYDNFKSSVLDEKTLSNFFFDWKGLITTVVKEGIKKADHGLVKLNESNNRDKKNTLEFEFDNFEELIDKYKELIIDKETGRFMIALLVNLCGADLLEQLSESTMNKLKNNIQKQLALDESKSDGNKTDDLFSDINFPLHYEPEDIIISEVKSIIEKIMKIQQVSDKGDRREISRNLQDVYEKYVLPIIDYTKIFDDVYEAILTYQEGLNKARVLRNLHFLLTMLYTLDKLQTSYHAKSTGNINNDSYYNLVAKQIDPKNDYVINLNYTDLLEETLEKVGKKVRLNYIHGKVGEFLELNAREIVDAHGDGIPNFVSQSSLKPIMSVDMIERYHEAYDKLRNADKCIIIAFRMNRDDSHILNLLQAAIRQRISQGKLFKVYVYAGKNIENSRGYKKLCEYIEDRYGSSGKDGKTKRWIEFYTYENIKEQDLQVGCKKEINLSYLSFKEFLDKIYNKAHN